MSQYDNFEKFVDRHIGPNDEEINAMLERVDVKNIEEMIYNTIPDNIKLQDEIKFSPAETEFDFTNRLAEIAKKNKLYKSYIGMGYYPTVTPAPIKRNILENPGWYTQYTPYQAEISQGRLEALLNFQTMICDLTAMPIANSSLLDEGTAAAEAMGMLFSSRKGAKKKVNKFFASEGCFPQTLDVLKTRALPLGIDLVIGKVDEFDFSEEYFGAIIQYPAQCGQVFDHATFIKKAKDAQILVAVAADLMALTLLTPPGEYGADVVVGTTQRFGVPMGFGGPHAGFFATKEEFKRQIPGRIIGVSVDSKERPALRMALQTREQHIKREKATSNICTAQVLLAIMSGMYAVYHGSKGIKNIANRIHNLTKILDQNIQGLGYTQINCFYFDTIRIAINNNELLNKIKDLSIKHEMNFRYFDDSSIGISLNERTSIEEIKEILRVFAEAKNVDFNDQAFTNTLEINKNVIPEEYFRTGEILTHPVFSKYHSETELMRYIKRLENKDLSLTASMIPLGSCTMKLNAATQLYPITWPEFAEPHPFAPQDQVEGYLEMINDFEEDLCKITGFSAISFQPNSGAQGEYAGLMVIKTYHESRGDNHRNIVLIPSSAHGTNPASAVMTGSKVIVVKCDEDGNIDVKDLKLKAEENKDNLSALMVTYPSTHGVFEESIIDVCKIIHENGGQVYMDGANMNAQIGITSPGFIGADVCHLNLHKTFAIPHGGGGPGVGPIGVAEHLVEFLPGHSVVDINKEKSMTAVSAAQYGSAGVLSISYAYIKMMGWDGLKKATEVAILNANYIKARLEKHYPVLYAGVKGFVAHELIFDLRGFKQTANIEVEDVAKRLMDYGFHAPTVSFPVPGTLMVEPTESESKYELDRFCDAMISIKSEIDDIVNGKSDKENNLLKKAPFTSADIASAEWNYSFTREEAAFPVEGLKDGKFWPSVGRINNAYGDRNLVCSCLPIEEYE